MTHQEDLVDTQMVKQVNKVTNNVERGVGGGRGRGISHQCRHIHGGRGRCSGSHGRTGREAGGAMSTRAQESCGGRG